MAVVLLLLYSLADRAVFVGGFTQREMADILTKKNWWGLIYLMDAYYHVL